MEINIFVEGSNTTANSKNVPVEDYYQGLFRSISSLKGDLSNYGETKLYVFSDDFGVAKGSEMADSVLTSGQSIDSSMMVDNAQECLRDAAASADVMIILLSTNLFKNTVNQIWNELVSVATPESIWCLGAAQSALSDLELHALEKKECTVLTYQRVGVARLGKETRSELLEAVRQKSR
jgi:hypothetical protein